MKFLRQINAAAALAAALLSPAALAAGALDPTFGTAGKAVFDFTPTQFSGDESRGAAVQPDGRILALSQYTNNTNPTRVSVTRHLGDGSLDPSFGSGGRAVLDFGACAECPLGGAELVLLPGGSILVAVTELVPPQAPFSVTRNIAVTRLTSAGVVDSTFGTGGVARVNPEGHTLLGDIAVQPDGRILIVGSTGPSDLLFPPGQPPQVGPARWLVTRLTASGAPDGTFQDGAAGLSGLGPPSAAHRVGVQSDGHFVVVGRNAFGTTQGFRYEANGAVAANHAIAQGSDVTDIEIDSQDRVWLLASGSSGRTLFRFPAQLDGGVFIWTLPALPSGISYQSVLPLPDGSALVAGGATFSPPQGIGTVAKGAVVLKTDANQGFLDTSFGNRGVLALDRMFATDLARQPDGRVIVAGTQDASPAESGLRLALARVDLAGSAFVPSEWVSFPLQSLGVRYYIEFVTVTNVDVVPRTMSMSVSANLESLGGCFEPVQPGASCQFLVRHWPKTTTALFGFADSSQGTISISDDGGRNAVVRMYGAVERSLVQHYYQQVLWRFSDAPGSDYWNGEARRIRADIQALSGATVNNTAEAWNAMAMTFFGSAEFAARGPSDHDFVVVLYATFFDRGAEAAGLNYWMGQIQQGMPREMVLTAFMFSTEFISFNASYFGGATSRPEIDLVLDMYRGLLGRLPDSDGLTYWVRRVQTAQCQNEAAVRAQADEISSLFADGSEYASRGRTNAQYVADLYNAFLRRAGDLDGFGYWKGQLDGGARTREELRAVFLQSAEFSARVQQVIDAGCKPQ